MPAAAVIPAPIAYIKVVAVKKLVVGFLVGTFGRPLRFALKCSSPSLTNTGSPLSCVGLESSSFTVKKLECFRQARPEYISME